MSTLTRTLTVGEIRKAIGNLPDDAAVRLDVATSDEWPEEFDWAFADVTLEHAFRDVLNGVLVIQGQLD